MRRVQLVYCCFSESRLLLSRRWQRLQQGQRHVAMLQLRKGFSRRSCRPHNTDTGGIRQDCVFSVQEQTQRCCSPHAIRQLRRAYSKAPRPAVPSVNQRNCAHRDLRHPACRNCRLGLCGERLAFNLVFLCWPSHLTSMMTMVLQRFLKMRQYSAHIRGGHGGSTTSNGKMTMPGGNFSTRSE